MLSSTSAQSQTNASLSVEDIVNSNEPVVVEVEVAQFEQVEEDGALGQRADAVAAEIEPRQRRQVAHGGRELVQQVVAQFQLLQQVLQAAEGVGVDTLQAAPVDAQAAQRRPRQHGAVQQRHRTVGQLQLQRPLRPDLRPQRRQVGADEGGVGAAAARRVHHALRPPRRVHPQAVHGRTGRLSFGDTDSVTPLDTRNDPTTVQFNDDDRAHFIPLTYSAKG